MLALSSPQTKRFAYGYWRYHQDDIEVAQRMLSLARENGIDHLDTADIYGGAGGFGGSERLLGTLRARAPSLFEGAVLATKAGVEFGSPYNSSADYLTSACDGSLTRLGVERVDLFYIHRPDFLTHPADLARTLDGLAAAGKIGTVGVSNFTPHQLDALSQHMKSPIQVHQLEFSAAHVVPLYDGTLDQAMGRGISVAAWSPLAGGRLGGAEKAGTPALERVREVLKKLSALHGVSSGAIALAFLRRHPAPVTPILGTTSPSRLAECLKSASVELTRAEWYALVEASRGEKMP